MSRFDHVEFDLAHIEIRKEAKQLCLDLESFVDQMTPSRAKSLALTALEESYMWIGKGLRDSQVRFDQNQKFKSVTTARPPLPENTRPRSTTAASGSVINPDSDLAGVTATNIMVDRGLVETIKTQGE